MRVRTPPRNLHTYVTSISPLYDTQPRYPLRIETPGETTTIYNPVTEERETVSTPGPVLEYEIHAEQAQSRADAERLGLDENQALFECQVVKAPDGLPLSLPEHFGAGSTFPLTFLGRNGRAEIIPTPDARFEAERSGQKFTALWRASS